MAKPVCYECGCVIEGEVLKESSGHAFHPNSARCVLALKAKYTPLVEAARAVVERGKTWADERGGLSGLKLAVAIDALAAALREVEGGK